MAAVTDRQAQEMYQYHKAECDWILTEYYENFWTGKGCKGIQGQYTHTVPVYKKNGLFLTKEYVTKLKDHLNLIDHKQYMKELGNTISEGQTYET